MTEKRIAIQGMSCNHCVMAVKKELMKLPDLQVREVQIGSVSVAYDESKVTPTQILTAITEAGYTPIP